MGAELSPFFAAPTISTLTPMSNLPNGHRDRRLKQGHRRRCHAANPPCALCGDPITAGDDDHRWSMGTGRVVSTQGPWNHGRISDSEPAGVGAFLAHKNGVPR